MSYAVNPEHFAQIVARALSLQKNLDGEIGFAPDKFALLVNDRSGTQVDTLFLGEFYRDYCQAQDSQKDAIVELACATVEKSRIRLSLLPQIVERWSLEKMRLEGQVVPPHYLLTEHFALVVKSENRLVGAQTLITAGLSFEAATRLAGENLHRRTRFVFSQMADESGSRILFATSSWQDGYDSARFIFAEELLKLPIAGEHVVFLINENYMFITGSRSEAGLLYGLSELSNAGLEGKSLPPFPILMKKEGYLNFELPEMHSLKEMFKEQENDYYLSHYRQQGALLEDYARKNNLTLAAFELAKDRRWTGKKSVTLVEPNKGMVLVPCADYVRVRGRGGNITVYTWDDFVDEYAEKLEETEHYPFRCLLRSF